MKNNESNSICGPETEILIVDDNQVNLMMASSLVQRLGYSFKVAENGLVALEKAKKQSFSLVLMDCSMPVMDGITSTQKIRELADYAETPIIGLTANILTNNLEECIAAGMNEVLFKPVKKQDLKTILEKFLLV